MLYSHKGAYPTILPNRIRLADGSTRTDPSTFTSEEIADAGYVLASDPPSYDTNTQRLTWDSDWTIENFDSAELAIIENENWVGIREERDDLLQESDIIVLREIEDAEEISQELKTYRTTLRDIPQDYENSTSVVWPDKPWLSSDTADSA
tara:strand:+ start:209 stop:658 length:450 start_codon:yes stop_codon:yes gene_type:complete